MTMPKKETTTPVVPTPVAAPPKAEEKTVKFYGYAPTGLLGHYQVLQLELSATDPRVKVAADKMPKRGAFEKVLFLLRQELFRAVATYKRPPQEPGAV